MAWLRLGIAILLTFATARGIAQEHEHPAGGNFGVVHFVTSCNESAQTQIDRAVALLHSFQFNRSIAGFDAALREDTACAVAYWGIALSEWGNPFAPRMKDTGQLRLGRENIQRGKSLGAKTERERDYVVAIGELYENFEGSTQHARLIAYRDAMGRLAAKYPEDHEAQIFYALALSASEDPADKTYAGRLRAGVILEDLFRREPTHPGLAHYIIHTYDVPALAPQALAAARRYAQIAPDAPHALHMPSHTFTRLGYWQESIDSNLAAAAAAKREGQTAEELHVSDYEMYAYLQTAQDEAAGRIVHSLPEIESRFDATAALSGAGSPSTGFFALAAIPARYALERQDWQQAAQLTPKQTPYPYTDGMTWFARGLGAARLGQVVVADESAAALQSIKERLATANDQYWSQQVEIQQLAVAAWAALARGEKKIALQKMNAAAALEDTTEKSGVTPGPLAPARELLGEMLLELHDPAQALEQFAATLKKEPRRFRSLYGAARAAKLMGRGATSRDYFQQLLQVCADADQPGRAELREARATLAKRAT